MITDNFTSDYLALLREEGVFNRITDGFMEIDTIRIGKPIKLRYFKPRIIIDKYMNENIVAEPDIKNISYEELKNYGVTLVGLPVSGNGWFKKQKVQYKILKTATTEARQFELLARPRGHHFQIDVANKRVRIIGRNAGYGGIGQWVRL